MFVNKQNKTSQNALIVEMKIIRTKLFVCHAKYQG